jgi:hypothetical protein
VLLLLQLLCYLVKFINHPLLLLAVLLLCRLLWLGPF